MAKKYFSHFSEEGVARYFDSPYRTFTTEEGTIKKELRPQFKPRMNKEGISVAPKYTLPTVTIAPPVQKPIIPTPTTVEVDQITTADAEDYGRKTKRRGRSPTILTGPRGVAKSMSGYTLGRPSLLGA